MVKLLHVTAILPIAAAFALALPAPAAASPMPSQDCIDQGGSAGAWVAGDSIYECTLPGTPGASGLTGSSAASDECDGAIIRVNCGKKGEGIYAILNIVVNVLTAGVGIAATAGFIFAGFRYSQSRDSVEGTAGAKKMIVNIIIGLAVWAVFFVALKWLLPGM